ncbi:hypothetical protein FRX31_005395 [Thalictrum thalictroides]|uniref:Uncharacterized protein n=1 Tax=Thalictrum thalictroides TaxID=46969 RepID=A0A7J6X5D3_THATH|nr:hypothetical protein FRX31_005395 [Thalictrum thalictroides]
MLKTKRNFNVADKGIGWMGVHERQFHPIPLSMTCMVFTSVYLVYTFSAYRFNEETAYKFVALDRSYELYR